jgi:uncharacterized secreted protein with C-terminal beta-propeller domain
MKKHPVARVAVALSALALLTTACTNAQIDHDLDADTGAPRLHGALTSFDNCDQALKALKTHAKQYATASVFGYGIENDAAGGKAGAAQADGKAPSHSTTNVQEAGIDEPDMVKNDGKRILAVRGGKLYVVSAAKSRITGTVKLDKRESSNYGYLGDGEILLHGDRALVILPYSPMMPMEWKDEPTEPRSHTDIKLVDLSHAKPKVVSQYSVEGDYVDARAVDGVNRVVVRSSPHFEIPQSGAISDDTVREAIDDSEISDWMPRYISDGKTGQIGCRSMARPSDYSGTSTLSVLTFGSDSKLGDGDPVSIEADGSTVYGSADSLYVANDRREFATGDWRRPAPARTELYRFSIKDDGAPSFAGSAKVPGYLLNQYSMSEWDGHLRVATTTSPQTTSDSSASSSSTVYELAVGADDMKRVGKLGGLGADETIQAVRFVDDTGYVVTYRQTDPLFVLDLSDPKHPKQTGKLKMNGFSSYLHPMSADRLIGVGQAGDSSGATTGAQVSLFDVHDRAHPKREDEYHADSRYSYSQAASDPHAFTYWAKRDLLVVPMADGNGRDGALLLTVKSDSVKYRATVTHKGSNDGIGISRSLVIGDTLWTVSGSGMKASDLDKLSSDTWVPFD